MEGRVHVAVISVAKLVLSLEVLVTWLTDRAGPSFLRWLLEFLKRMSRCASALIATALLKTVQPGQLVLPVTFSAQSMQVSKLKREFRQINIGMDQRLSLNKTGKQSALSLIIFSLTASKLQHAVPHSWDLTIVSLCVISAKAVGFERQAMAVTWGNCENY